MGYSFNGAVLHLNFMWTLIDALDELNDIGKKNGFSGKPTGISSEGYTSSLTFNSSLLQPGGTIFCKNISGSIRPCNSSELSCPV